MIDTFKSVITICLKIFYNFNSIFSPKLLQIRVLPFPFFFHVVQIALHIFLYFTDFSVHLNFPQTSAIYTFIRDPMHIDARLTCAHAPRR